MPIASTWVSKNRRALTLGTRLAAIRRGELAAAPVISWGELLWDLFPDGRRLGGAPANVAFHLATLGCPVALATRVGDDAYGREAAAALARRGVDTSLVQIDRALPTGRVEVEVHGGEPSYRLVPGCAWERIEVAAETAAALARAGAFCFGTLSQRLDHRELERALALLPAESLTVCDLNLRRGHPVDAELVRMSLRASAVVKLNDVEARLLAEQMGVADAVAWMLDELGVELVALTRGPHGSVLVTSEGAWDHPGHAAAPGGDNVGAGDAFVAALVHGLRAGGSLDEINRAANRYAAFVASRRGATPDVPEDVLREVLARV